VDTAALLATNSAHRIPGEEFFYEHVHLTFPGNYLIARAAAEQIGSLLPSHIASKAVSNHWLPASECARRLAWTDWNRRHVLEDLRRRLLDPPFTNQLGHAERIARLDTQLAELSAAIRPEGLQEAARQYRDALAFAPDDWVLHEKLAEVLRDLRDARGAIEQWEHVVRLLPHYPGTHNNLGNLYSALGNAAEAEKQFLAALRLRPDLAEALNGMGLLLGRPAEVFGGDGYYNKALRAKPDFVPAHINLGILFASRGKTSEAMRHYNERSGFAPTAVSRTSISRSCSPAGAISRKQHPTLRKRFG
jgi:tetratricopeptide (TPR) repeat protein